MPIGIGGIGIYLPLSVPVLLQIEMACHLLYHESTVAVHEILSLDCPSGIIQDIILLYKGYVINGNLPVWELTEFMRIYNTNKMYLRNDTFPLDAMIERVKADGKEIVLSFISVRGLTIGIILIAFNDGNKEYDSWMIDKAKRVLSDLQELGAIDRIEEEYKRFEFKIEKELVDATKK